MKSNNLIKNVLYLTAMVIVLVIFVPTIYKIVNNSRNKQALANEKLIIEKAKKCIYEGKCKSNTITLKDLYDLNYIREKIVNPFDKTIYSEESYVVITKEGSTFYLK